MFVKNEVAKTISFNQHRARDRAGGAPPGEVQARRLNKSEVRFSARRMSTRLQTILLVNKHCMHILT